MKPIGACIFVVYFLMIFASLVRFYVFVMPPGGSKWLAVDVSIVPYQWLGRSVSYHEVLTPVQLLPRLQNHHHHHTQVATTTTPQTSLAMDQEEKKQVQSIIDQLKGHSLPDGGEILESINSSSSEFNATNNRAHIFRQYESSSTVSERKTTRETPNRKGITFSLFSLEDLLQYFVRNLIKAVSVCILLAIYIFCSKVSLHLRVRSSTQPSASQQVEIVKRILLSLSDDFAATIDNSPYEPIRYPRFFRYDTGKLPIPPVPPLVPCSYAGPAYGGPVYGGPVPCSSGGQVPCSYEGEITIPPVPALVPYPYEEIRIPPPVPAPPPKAPKKPKLPPRRGQTKVTIAVNLQKYFGHKRKDVAAHLGVSVSTFKRICRLQGIKQWQNRMGSSGSVSKPPDQHGERNTSTARETPSHNVQTGMEGKLFGQNEVANVFRRDFMGGPIALNTFTARETPSQNVQTGMEGKPVGQNQESHECRRDFMERQIALNTESGLIMVSRPPDKHGERNTSTACETPSRNVETGMEVELFGQNEVANVFQRDFMGGPIALNTENVPRPPDQHGEKNTSTACETPSRNVETGMEVELFGQNEVANVFRRDFMGGPIALNTENGLIMVSRPPDQHGERNTSTACGTPSRNVETGMEVEPIGQNQEANVFRRDFMGGPIALNTDGLSFLECSDAVAPSQSMATILDTIPHLTEGSSECAFQVKNQSTQFTANPYPNGLVDPHPQIALTQILSKNMERLEDRRNLLAPRKEPLPEGHVFGSVNWTVRSCSDLALSQPMPTIPHTTESSKYWRTLALLEEHLLEENDYGSISLTAPSSFDPGPSQPMHTIPHTVPTIPQMMPFLTERRDMRSVRLKATYGNTTIKFHFPLLSGFNELKEEVSKRLEFERGSFKLEYKDEEGDSVLIACDEDVRDYLQLLTSLGNQVIKLFVLDKVPNVGIGIN